MIAQRLRQIHARIWRFADQQHHQRSADGGLVTELVGNAVHPARAWCDEGELVQQHALATDVRLCGRQCRFALRHLLGAAAVQQFGQRGVGAPDVGLRALRCRAGAVQLRCRHQLPRTQRLQARVIRLRFARLCLRCGQCCPRLCDILAARPVVQFRQRRAALRRLRLQCVQLRAAVGQLQLHQRCAGCNLLPFAHIDLHDLFRGWRRQRDPVPLQRAQRLRRIARTAGQ
ncbi:hypothetical protein D3C81_1522960 [compost metagenome]